MSESLHRIRVGGDKLTEGYCIVKRKMAALGRGNEVECWTLAEGWEDAEGAYRTGDSYCLIKTCPPDDVRLVIASREANRKVRKLLAELKEML